ncbi:MAG: iron complex transport system permease protein [Paraglaciecola sp.]
MARLDLGPLFKRNCLILLSLLLVVSAVLVLFIDLNKPFSNQVERQILLQLRLPTVLTAFIVGAGLAVSSATLQVLLRNPLADPGIIGISSGASLCAALLLLIGGGWSFAYLQYILPLFCFFGAMLSTLLIYGISRRMAVGSSAVILAGIGISTISGAIIAWLYFFSDAQSMRNLSFWLMGSLHQADWSILAVALPLMLLLLAYSLRQGKRLNWYYFGGSTAQLAGLDIRVFNKKMLLVCALMVGICVSIAGSIAFIGLLVPHLLRNFFGFDNRFVLPASALLGGTLLMWVLLLSNSFGGVNVPVSMLTASIGGPIFLYSVARLGRRA